MEDFSSPKIQTLDDAAIERQSLKERGQRVVLTNGCFDLLHAGHVAFLKAARALGDLLIVCLNSDTSVRALKGPERPLNLQQHRAFCLAGLECVDRIIIFDSLRLVREIEVLSPDIYCKAGDYSLETIDATERSALEAVGSEIHFLPFAEGISTTGLVEKLKQLNAS